MEKLLNLVLIEVIVLTVLFSMAYLAACAGGDRFLSIKEWWCAWPKPYDTSTSSNVATPDERPGSEMASKITKVIAQHTGKQVPWSVAVEVSAICCDMSDEEKAHLLAMDT